MDEVRRPVDDELCGFVDQQDGRWRALVVFGAVLGRHDGRDDAIRHVREQGLGALAEPWLLRGADGSEEVVCIVEASPTRVTVARDYVSMPGVPTLSIAKAELDAGTWTLRR